MFREIINMIIAVILLVFVTRTFLFQPFHIPSGSMRPTLIEGDHLFVSKYTYGFSDYSLPFHAGLFSGRIWAGKPRRGDVVVFHYRDADYIKRIIGLPGDNVQLVNGTVYINNIPLPRSFTGQTLYPSPLGYDKPAPVYRETADREHTYLTLDTVRNGSGDNTRLFHVPEGHFFVLGDNRDNSSDSRFSAPLGFIPFENIIGKARLIYFSKGRSADNKNPHIRWNRIFQWIS